jgi:D-xylose transport system permease protein
MTVVAPDPPHPRSARFGLGPMARRLRRVEGGPLPVLLGLVLLWGVFAWKNEHFLSARNLTNLVLQIAAMGTISAGIVLVLLLGEIDLSVGAVSGLCAAVMAVLDVQRGLAAVPSLVVAVAAGALIGLFQGLWFTRFRVPSFVVTLAGLLAWQGALLYVLGSTGTINIYDPVIDALTGVFLPPWLGWVSGKPRAAQGFASTLSEWRSSRSPARSPRAGASSRPRVSWPSISPRGAGRSC